MVSRPFITPAIVAVNVAAFLLMLALGAGILKPDGALYLKWGANFHPLTASGQWWRLVTALFLHYGLLHLAMNMWALWSAGRLTEILYGSARYGFVYLAAGTAASLASLLWNPDSSASVGASGAVFGVFGALGAFLAKYREQVNPRALKSLAGSTVAFVLFSLFYGLVQPGIDNAAHVGGLVSGFGLGWLLARPLDAETTRPAAPLAAVAVPAALVLAVMWWLVPPPRYDYRQEERLKDEVAWFAKEEDAILAGWKQAVDGRRSGALDDLQLADRLDEAARRWDGGHRRLAAVNLTEKSPSKERHALLLEYVRLRRDSTRALVAGLRTEDRARLEEFKALQREVDGVREALKKAGEKPRMP